MKARTTVYVDFEVYAKWKTLCEKRGMKLSRVMEDLMLKQILLGDVENE
jgi:hypothetical protein